MDFEILKRLISLTEKTGEQSWVIDGGYHLGTFSQQILNQIPELKILGFEPDTETLDKAKKRWSSDNVILVNAALSFQSGVADFFKGPISATNSLLPRPEVEQKGYYPNAAKLYLGPQVNLTTIDDECDRHGITNISILKLDLQGAEILALKGATRILEKQVPEIVVSEGVFIEKYEKQPLAWKTWHFLEKYGYSLFSFNDIKIGPYDKTEGGLRSNQWNQCDMIFVSPEIRKLIETT